MNVTAARNLRQNGRPLAIFFLGITGCLFWLGALALRAQQMPLPKLRPPHDEVGPTFWEQHHWPIVVGGVALLIVIPLTILWFRRPKSIVVMPPEIIARNSLARLRGEAESGALVVEVSRIVRNYLVAVFMLPPDELTTTELLGALQSRSQIDQGVSSTIGTFLRQCDEWKFAPAKLPPQTGVIGSASDIVEMVEKQRHLPPVTRAQPPITSQSAP